MDFVAPHVEKNFTAFEYSIHLYFQLRNLDVEVVTLDPKIFHFATAELCFNFKCLQ